MIFRIFCIGILILESTKGFEFQKSRNYTISGFQLILNELFLEKYYFAQNLTFFDCEIEFRENEPNDFWNLNDRNNMIENIYFKNSIIKGDSNEAYGNGLQEKLQNLQEVVYENCVFYGGITGPIFFVNSATVTRIAFINCTVSFFDYNALNTLQNLREFEVRMSNILVDPGMFSGNQKLKVLKIPSNNFDKWFLQELPPSLEYLDISDMKSEIYCVSVQSLKNLKFLNMSHTNYLFSRFRDCIPSTFRSLEVLDFSRNSLKIVSNLFFSGMNRLQELYLKENAIDKDAFRGMYNLRKLYLNDNNLTIISKETFQDLYSFELLDLRGNNISSETIQDLGSASLTQFYYSLM